MDDSLPGISHLRWTDVFLDWSDCETELWSQIWHFREFTDRSSSVASLDEKSWKNTILPKLEAIQNILTLFRPTRPSPFEMI